MTLTAPMRLVADIQLEVEPSEGGGFIAFNDDLHVAASGATEQEAINSFLDGVRELVSFCAERQLPLPTILHV